MDELVLPKYATYEEPKVIPEAPVEAATFGEQFRLATQDLPTVRGVEALAEPRWGFDPQFDINTRKDLTDGIPEDSLSDVLDSVTEAEAIYHRTRVFDDIERHARMQTGGGVSAAGAEILSYVVDPTTWIGGAGEIATAARIIGKGTRLTRALTMGATTSLSTAAQGALQSAGSSSRDEEDVLYEAMLGLGLGTVGGAFIPGKLGAEVQAIRKDVSKRATGELDDRLLNPKKLDEGNVADEQIDIMGREYETPVETLDEHGAVIAKEVADGGLSTPQIDNIIRKADEEATKGTFDPNALLEDHAVGKALSNLGLFDDFLTLFKMPGNTIKHLSYNILENASGKVGRTSTAAIMKLRRETALLDIAMPHFRKGYRDYARAKGIRPLRNINQYHGVTRQAFNDDIYMEMANRKMAQYHGTPHVPNADATVNFLADKLEEMGQATLKMNKAAGLMQDVAETVGYMPLKWKGAAMRKLFQVTGNREAYTKLISKGYRAMEIDPDVSDKIAHAVIRRAESADLGIDANPHALLSKDSREVLRDILVEDGRKSTEIDELFKLIDGKREKAGQASAAKRRTPIDLTMSDGDRRLIDLVDTDVQTLMTRNAVEGAGRSSLALKGLKSDSDISALKRAALKDARANGATADQTQLMERTMDSLFDQFHGRPSRGGVNKKARRLMDWSMVTALGMVGAAQAAETATVFAAHGVMNTLKHVPALSAARKALRAGDAEGAGVLGEFKALIGGLWDEELLRRPSVRLEDQLGDDSASMKMLDNVLASATDMIGYASGMNQIKTVQQQATVLMQTDKVFKELSKATISDTVLKRFADVGWDAKTLTKLQKQVKKGNVTFQANGAVDRLNMEKWPTDLVEIFAEGIHRHSSQVIQKPLIGESKYWMHETVGAMMTQFRSFPLLAIQKQTSRHIKMGDAESYLALQYGIMLSTAMSLTKAAVMDVGSTREESRLDKATSVAGLAKSSLQYASILPFASELMDGASFLTGMTLPGGSQKSQIGLDVPAFTPATRLIKGTAKLGQNLFKQTPVKKSTISNIAAPIIGNTLPAVWINNGLQAFGED